MTHPAPPAPASNAMHADRGYRLVADASLAGLNTLRVAARAAWLAEVHDPAALPGLLAEPALGGLPRLLLGEGSNVLFAGDWQGVVVSIRTHGVQVLGEDEAATHIRIAAGEHWDDCVRWSLAQGYPGLENLILIPGSVGAAPLQNIGAYGVEAGEFVHSVSAFDLESRQSRAFTHAECAFGYRDSVFKRHPDRWLVTAVELRLPRTPRLRLEYAGLREELSRAGVERPAPIHVAEAVERLRTRKLPDPNVIGNAGSFFKNPLVDAGQAHALLRENPAMPCWPVPGERAKLSAAWMIEQCGFKGLREGDAGISNRHALVLVNHGHATGRGLWALAQRVREGVRSRFGVLLEPEPRIIGA